MTVLHKYLGSKNVKFAVLPELEIISQINLITFNYQFSFQRYVLLYGVGKARDEARAAVKKLTKEICKLFSKKCSIDIAEGRMHSVYCLYGLQVIIIFHILNH